MNKVSLMLEQEKKVAFEVLLKSSPHLADAFLKENEALLGWYRGEHSFEINDPPLLIRIQTILSSANKAIILKIIKNNPKIDESIITADESLLKRILDILSHQFPEIIINEKDSIQEQVCNYFAYLDEERVTIASVEEVITEKLLKEFYEKISFQNNKAVDQIWTEHSVLSRWVHGEVRDHKNEKIKIVDLLQLLVSAAKIRSFLIIEDVLENNNLLNEIQPGHKKAVNDLFKKLKQTKTVHVDKLLSQISNIEVLGYVKDSLKDVPTYKTIAEKASLRLDAVQCNKMQTKSLYDYIGFSKFKHLAQKASVEDAIQELANNPDLESYLVGAEIAVGHHSYCATDDELCDNYVYLIRKNFPGLVDYVFEKSSRIKALIESSDSSSIKILTAMIFSYSFDEFTSYLERDLHKTDCVYRVLLSMQNYTDENHNRGRVKRLVEYLKDKNYPLQSYKVSNKKRKQEQRGLQNNNPFESAQEMLAPDFAASRLRGNNNRVSNSLETMSDASETLRDMHAEIARVQNERILSQKELHRVIGFVEFEAEITEGESILFLQNREKLHNYLLGLEITIDGQNYCAEDNILIENLKVFANRKYWKVVDYLLNNSSRMRDLIKSDLDISTDLLKVFYHIMRIQDFPGYLEKKLHTLDCIYRVLKMSRTSNRHNNERNQILKAHLQKNNFYTDSNLKPEQHQQRRKSNNVADNEGQQNNESGLDSADKALQLLKTDLYKRIRLSHLIDIAKNKKKTKIEPSKELLQNNKDLLDYLQGCEIAIDGNSYCANDNELVDNFNYFLIRSCWQVVGQIFDHSARLQNLISTNDTFSIKILKSYLHYSSFSDFRIYLKKDLHSRACIGAVLSMPFKDNGTTRQRIAILRDYYDSLSRNEISNQANNLSQPPMQQTNDTPENFGTSRETEPASDVFTTETELSLPLREDGIDLETLVNTVTRSLGMVSLTKGISKAEKKIKDNKVMKTIEQNGSLKDLLLGQETSVDFKRYYLKDKDLCDNFIFFMTRKYWKVVNYLLDNSPRLCALITSDEEFSAKILKIFRLSGVANLKKHLKRDLHSLDVVAEVLNEKFTDNRKNKNLAEVLQKYLDKKGYVSNPGARNKKNKRDDVGRRNPKRTKTVPQHAAHNEGSAPVILIDNAQEDTQPVVSQMVPLSFENTEEAQSSEIVLHDAEHQNLYNIEHQEEFLNQIFSENLPVTPSMTPQLTASSSSYLRISDMMKSQPPRISSLLPTSNRYSMVPHFFSPSAYGQEPRSSVLTNISSEDHSNVINAPLESALQAYNAVASSYTSRYVPTPHSNSTDTTNDQANDMIISP